LARETKAAQAAAMRKSGDVRDGTGIGKIASSTLPKNNTSGVRGVCWHSRLQKWQARIGFKGTCYPLYTGSDFDAAVAARRAAEAKYFGEYLESIGKKYDI
jgi:hypothetical protein